MVPIIENYAIVSGKVEKITPLDSPKNFVQIDLLFEQSINVENFPNLALADIGKSMPINIDTQLAKSIHVGSFIKMKVKKVSNILYYAVNME